MHLCQRVRFPCAVERLGLRPVETHGSPERPIGRGQPVGLLVLARRIFLDIDRQAAVGCFWTHNIGDSRGRLTLPVRPGHEKHAAVVARCTAPGVGKVLRVPVDELQREVAVLVNGRHCEDQRLSPQIHPDEGIGRIRIGGLDRFVLRRENARHVIDLVPRRLVLRTLLIHEVGILNPIVIHHRIALDIGLLADLAGFLRCDTNLGTRHRIRLNRYVRLYR